MSDPRDFPIPIGWIPANASTRPLYLESAEQFGHGRTPTPDDWVHVAPLTPPRLRSVIGLGVFFVVLAPFAVLFFSRLGSGSQANDVIDLIFGAIVGVFALLALVTFVSALRSAIIRRQWPYTQGIAFGRRGLMIRMQLGKRANVSWHEITELKALMRRPGTPESSTAVPILYIARGTEQWSINPDELGSSPAVVFALLHYYWTRPHRRADFGTTFAQQRMDEFAASPSTSAAPWVFDERLLRPHETIVDEE